MEKVLVVPTQLLDDYLSKDSFITTDISEIVSFIRKRHTYIDRNIAETDESYKQIIPYAIVMNEDRIFMTRRLKKQTEKRLHGLYTIGMGGHINPTEESADDVIVEGMRRELFEEIGLDDYRIEGCVGIINDHAADVSNYHLGLVYLIHTSENVKVQETSKMIGAWATRDEIQMRYPEMESWSKIAWEHRSEWIK